MSGQDLFYDGTWVMKNRLNIRSRDDLELVEKKIATLKSFSLHDATQNMGFGLDRLKAIHKHLFEDLYDWAGQERDFEAKKFSNTQTFMDPSEFQDTFAEIEQDLIESGWFEEGYKVSQDEFSSKIADIYTKVNSAHPFPEGNGRAAREYLKAIGAEVGYTVDFDMTSKEAWYDAAKKSFEGNKAPLKILFKEISSESDVVVTAELDMSQAQQDKKFLSMFNLNMDAHVPDFQSKNNPNSRIIQEAQERSQGQKKESDGPHP